MVLMVFQYIKRTPPPLKPIAPRKPTIKEPQAVEKPQVVDKPQPVARPTKPTEVAEPTVVEQPTIVEQPTVPVKEAYPKKMYPDNGVSFELPIECVVNRTLPGTGIQKTDGVNKETVDAIKSVLLRDEN